MGKHVISTDHADLRHARIAACRDGTRIVLERSGVCSLLPDNRVTPMIHGCFRPTAAAPLLGPALRIIRSTPLARLLIGYRAIYPTSLACRAVMPCEPRKIPPVPCPCGPRGLGEALLLERLLVGGNQNEGLPLANWRIAVERRNAELGRGLDCYA